jgi:hypothetical protein
VKKDETPAPVASAVKTEETTKTETAVTKAEPVKPDSIWEVVPDGVHSRALARRRGARAERASAGAPA